MAAREVLNLTKAAVESLSLPEAGKRYIVRDAKQPGLELYLHPKLSAVTAKVGVRRAEQMTTEELREELKEMGVDVTMIASSLILGDDTMH